MAFGVRDGAAVARPSMFVSQNNRSPSIDPWQAEFAGLTADAAGRCPEIDCIRPSLTADVADAAEARAAALGVGADRVLITAGVLSEEDYLRALAASLGVAFEPLDGTPRAACPVDNDRLLEAAAAGLLPLTIDNDLNLVVAPRGTSARRIASMIDSNPALAHRFRFTSAERLNRFVLRCGGKALISRASEQLKHNWPMLSAAPPRWRMKILPVAITAMLTLAAIVMAPTATMFAFELTLAAVFLAWLGLRLSGAFVDWQAPKSLPDLSDDALPVYTIIAALYHEAASVNGLLTAIERLDYPAEKLDVIIAVEADDSDTRAAITARKSRIPITVIPVPASQPRTKPKALNVALPFARGTFTVIYDAEDRPEPNQLRRAVDALRAGGDSLACVQARLCIDNTADSWLTRLFTAEYAGQFDVFLPGLAALRLPLPLGGSSNHFHTAILREIRGWDPYNVTEDADLGMRLARFGYRSDVINSTTFEEAPAKIAAWLRQRTRWFKGWMQTWLVHMREPHKLLRDLGLPGFLTFQLIVGGSALAALVHPLFVAGLIYYGMVHGALMLAGADEGASILAWLYGASVVIGYFTSAFLGWLGLMRRGLLATAWVLLLTPVHWLLLSLAAWRAVYHLVAAPYTWDKTEHGLAKSSRLAGNLTRSLLELELYFRTLKESGNLPALADDPINTSATRRPLPRVAA
jgi:cellulose synthase/poly-beta-1,6-N-acetylglucosamine synthase-like glycosyltransferase